MDTDYCNKCSVKVKSDNSIKCNGCCGKFFHFKCLEISIKDAQIILNIEGVKWFCESCNAVVNCMLDIKKDINDFKNSVLEELNAFRKKLSNEDGDKEVNRRELNFAKAVKGEAIVIKPKVNQESSKTNEVIKKNLKPAEMEVGITQMRNVRDGGVLIKCKTKEEIEKVKKAAEKKLGKNYRINMPEQKNPCIKVLDLEDKLNEEDLLKTIRKQNAYLRHDNMKLKVVVIKKMKTRYMAIIECNPMAFAAIMEEGSLSIGWSPSCRVFEYVRVFRCFQCGGFNHKAEECKTKLCLICGDSEHSKDSCTSESVKCNNCSEANKKMNTEFDVNHSIFDHSCPVMQRKIFVEKQKIKIDVPE